MELDLVWQQFPPDIPNVADIIQARLKKKNCISGKRYGRERGFRCFELEEYCLVFQKDILRKSNNISQI